MESGLFKVYHPFMSHLQVRILSSEDCGKGSIVAHFTDKETEVSGSVSWIGPHCVVSSYDYKRKISSWLCRPMKNHQFPLKKEKISGIMYYCRPRGLPGPPVRSLQLL